ncbi:hypothetical protein K227x_53650 [Rubripirellula lacrimiformis]|uniref:Response regulatory domain-containing protein n=2 Tax=Rubripirellula lacrimiformis TaxID=1930273 RepID=A0A517NII0_9BACT|nr:hypothetical protein K227x_53650 [Rubripirellula lacrimiformis]
MICNMMSTLGFETTEASDGIEALQRLAEMETPDIVLVDWNMPEMDGLEFIKSVRRQAEHRDLPMMMVTTECEMDRMALAFVAGVNEYVMKPFTIEVIQSKLELLGIGVFQ